MELAQARRVVEQVVKKRTDRDPSYIMDLDDDPGTLGREFIEFARLWRNEMNAEAQKWGPPESGDDKSIDDMYRRMLDAFTIFGGKLLGIAKAHPVRPDPQDARWARLFQSAPRVGRMTEGRGVDIMELQEWFSKRDLAASSRGELEEAERALSMARYKLEKIHKRELVALIRNENNTGIRVKNADGSIPA